MPKLQKDSLTSVFVFVDAAVTVPQLRVFAPAGRDFPMLQQIRRANPLGRKTTVVGGTRNCERF